MTTSRREEIAQQAARLFATHGFHGVSVADIGAAVGLSGPALYRHFSSKQELLESLLVDVSKTLVEQGRRRSAERDDPRDALAALVDWHVEFAQRNRPLIVLQDRDWAVLDQQARESIRGLQLEYTGLWVDALTKASKPALDVVHADFRVRAVFGLLNSTPRLHHLEHPEEAFELREMAMAALLSPSPWR